MVRSRKPFLEESNSFGREPSTEGSVAVEAVTAGSTGLTCCACLLRAAIVSPSLLTDLIDHK